ncbi:MAG TPA: FRG domain-containing protein [Bryobacteraceae bacterium]|jgi:hypothetical protein|nr:FRG domain-containing protein [Bryobacteraceae bacterium]
MNIEACSDWRAVMKAFGQLPKPVLRRDSEGEPYEKLWIFRGHKKETYPLRPLIERDYPYMDWAEVEYKSLREFQSKAALHMDPARLPPTSLEFKLTWLATMQHYGLSTRLLDFTYSPYVALYFALRNREQDASGYAEVWGINATVIRKQAEKIGREADEVVRARQKDPKPRFRRVSLVDFESSRQSAQREDELWETLIRQALSPDAVRGTHFDRTGFFGACGKLPTGTRQK